jgi:V8-like Glu-specific endopeptidase
VNDPAILNDADSVVLLLFDDEISENPNPDGTFNLNLARFTKNPDGTSFTKNPDGTSKDLCNDVRFYNQEICGFCSGFLVAPDIVATAAHCVEPAFLEGLKPAKKLSDIRLVFGFRMLNDTTVRTTVSSSDVYKCVNLLGYQLTDGNGSDWALIKLDSPVLNHRIARIRTTGKIPYGQKVHVIGHPNGLPLKYADGAVVQKDVHGVFFVANLDTFGGNSGSPVFNSQTHIVEGIHVRGPNPKFHDPNGQGCVVPVQKNDKDALNSGSGHTSTLEFASTLNAAVWSDYTRLTLIGHFNPHWSL